MMHPEPLDRRHLDAAARLLGEAFRDEPRFCYIFRTARAQLRWNSNYYRAHVDLAYRMGLVQGIWADGPTSGQTNAMKLAAVSLWFAPHRRFPPPWYRAVLPALRLLPIMLEPGACRRMNQIARVDRRFVPPSRGNWWLGGLAVRGDYHGRGWGSKLVREGLRRAQRDASPVRLVCWSSTVPFYQRLGFSVDAETRYPGIDGTMFCLTRRPAGG